MKVSDAMISAIWCPETATAPSRPATSVLAEKIPTSSAICAAAGAPSRTIFRMRSE